MSERIGEIELPVTATKKPKPVEPRSGAWVPPSTPSVGSFFTEHRVIIDARKTHLGRMGMLPEHVNALRMPSLDERPSAPAILSEALPDANMAEDEDYAQPRLPKLLGVNVSLTDDETEE